MIYQYLFSIFSPIHKKTTLRKKLMDITHFVRRNLIVVYPAEVFVAIYPAIHIDFTQMSIEYRHIVNVLIEIEIRIPRRMCKRMENKLDIACISMIPGGPQHSHPL